MELEQIHELELEPETEECSVGRQSQDKPKKHDSGAADLERVTDYAEEKEISAEDLHTVLRTDHNTDSALTEEGQP